MKRALCSSLFTALLISLPSVGAVAVTDGGKIIVEEKRVVELADGGTIVIGKDARTYHVDAAGKRVRMKDGVVMEGKDGTKYLHRNDAIWKQIVEKGTLSPNR